MPINAPAFFEWGGNTLRTTGPPQVMIIATTEQAACAVCGRRTMRECEPVRATVESDRGTMWTDLVEGLSGAGFMVSERVVDGLVLAGIERFRCLAVDPGMEIRRKRLRGVPAPRYFLLRAAPGMSIDAGKSEARFPPVVCGVCGARDSESDTKRRLPNWIIAEADSWSGLDLFTPHEMPHLTLCTRRVIEIARRERWTNCRFTPVD